MEQKQQVTSKTAKKSSTTVILKKAPIASKKKISEPVKMTKKKASTAQNLPTQQKAVSRIKLVQFTKNHNNYTIPLQQQTQEPSFQIIDGPQNQIQQQQVKPQFIQQQQQQQVEQFQIPDQQQQELKQFDQQSLSQQQLNQSQTTMDTDSLLNVDQKQKNSEEESEISAIIITFCDGGSYDALFTSVPQESEEGTCIKVYQAKYSMLNIIVMGMKKQNLNVNDEEQALITQLLENLQKVDPENVVFNFECCSGCSGDVFPNTMLNKFSNFKYLVDEKYFLMFSDFSLKCLIKQWEAKELGPNPFVRLPNGCSSNFNLAFDNKQLADCPSSQLQKVGDLCDKGTCNVHAMGGTVTYTVDQQKTDTDKYKLEVLTIVTSIDNNKNIIPKIESQVCKIGKNKGIAGHVILSYPSGGQILTSMGHWMELMQLDTSDEQLLRVAERDYGVEYASQVRSEMNSYTGEQKVQFQKKKAAQFVQQSAPCKMKKKSKI